MTARNFRPIAFFLGALAAPTLAACGSSAAPEELGSSDQDLSASNANLQRFLKLRRIRDRWETGSTVLQIPAAGFHIVSGSAGKVGPSGQWPCTVAKVGLCELRECTSADVEDVPGVNIDINGLNQAFHVTTPSGIQFGPGPAFTAGQHATFSYSGSGLPETQTLTAPASITVTAPDNGATPLLIDRSQDLTVTWNGDAGGARGTKIDVQLNVTGPVPAGGGTTTGKFINCRFEPSEGQATIPSKLLRFLPAGPGGSLEIGTSQTKHEKEADGRFMSSLATGDYSRDATLQ